MNNFRLYCAREFLVRNRDRTKHIIVSHDTWQDPKHYGFADHLPYTRPEAIECHIDHHRPPAWPIVVVFALLIALIAWTRT